MSMVKITDTIAVNSDHVEKVSIRSLDSCALVINIIMATRHQFCIDEKPDSLTWLQYFDLIVVQLNGATTDA